MVDETTGPVRLTPEGRVVAESVVRRHRLAERFLADVLGLPWVKVHAEAAAWEHVISQDVEVAMRKVMGEPKTCPHGNPIPGMGYVAPPTVPISEMQAGDRGHRRADQRGTGGRPRDDGVPRRVGHPARPRDRGGGPHPARRDDGADRRSRAGRVGPSPSARIQVVLA